MKIKFLNNTINILQSDRALSYPFYDLNYAYQTILVSNHISLTENIDKETLNEIVLKGCIDLVSKYYTGINAKSNPIYDYIVSKINVLDDIYDNIQGDRVYPFKPKKEIKKKQEVVSDFKNIVKKEEE